MKPPWSMIIGPGEFENGSAPLVFVDGQMVVAPTVESFTTGETVTIVQTAILTQCVFPCNVPVLFDCVM